LIHKTTSNIKKIFPKRVSYQASPTYSLGEFPGVITAKPSTKQDMASIVLITNSKLEMKFGFTLEKRSLKEKVKN
jgi:hypothetical protein